ncbi:MAG: DUF2079 domain-containing protein, partial [Acidimicrobiales bacterium]
MAAGPVVTVAPPVPSHSAAHPRWVRWLPHLPIAALVVAYAVRFSLLSVSVYDGYGDPGFDMGIFDQGVWLLSRFETPFVTVMGRNLFGDHTSFVLLLAVPLYWIYPAAQTLLVLQSCLLAAAAVPIYLVGVRRLGNPWVATLLAAAYLLNPALQNGNLEQFHPECFGVFGIALALYAAIEWKPKLLVASVLLVLLVKEDTALLIVPLAVWIFFRRSKAWGGWIAVVAAAYMAFAYEVVIRTLLGTASFYANRIPFGGVGGLVHATVTKPGTVWNYLRAGGRPWYLWQMGFPFGLLFLIAPEVAFISLGTVGENVVSNFPYMHEIDFHYSLMVVPVLAMGTVWAVVRLRTLPWRALSGGVVFGCALWACTLWGLAPFSLSPYPHWSPKSPQVAQVNYAKEAIPPHAVVSAFYAFVP